MYQLRILAIPFQNIIYSHYSQANKEFSLGKRLINSYLNRFFFHTWTCNIKNHMHILNNTIINAFNNPHFSVVIADTSIRNNVTTSIAYIYSYNRLVTKIVHHIVNITTMEAECYKMSVWTDFRVRVRGQK